MLTAEDIAKMHKVDKRTVYRWTQSGVLPAPVQIGRTLRWRQQDIDAWHDYLREHRADREAGRDPYRPTGAAPPVTSTGIPLLDPRVVRARQRQRLRELQAEQRKLEREIAKQAAEQNVKVHYE